MTSISAPDNTDGVGTFPPLRDFSRQWNVGNPADERLSRYLRGRALSMCVTKFDMLSLSSAPTVSTSALVHPPHRHRGHVDSLL